MNYPNVIQEDFFAIQHEKEGINLEAWRERMAKTLRGKEREIVYPKYFDAIVGNPPYTRQEEIEDINTDIDTYKKDLIENALKHGSEQMATMSKRAGIHAYFFVHGTKFLKEGGRFGFIVSNSWLDTNYGRALQEFFLKYYKIVAIIESKVERWFSEADVNTCIVILEKCADEKARNENPVRFVYLKKKLRDFIPPTSQISDDSIERRNQISTRFAKPFSRTMIFTKTTKCAFIRAVKKNSGKKVSTKKNKATSAQNGENIFVAGNLFRDFEESRKQFVLL